MMVVRRQLSHPGVGINGDVRDDTASELMAASMMLKRGVSRSWLVRRAVRLIARERRLALGVARGILVGRRSGLKCATELFERLVEADHDSLPGRIAAGAGTDRAGFAHELAVILLPLLSRPFSSKGP